ncbi:MAG: hypothetical protein R3B09_33485 [Nannocystaceae bacterium]
MPRPALPPELAPLLERSPSETTPLLLALARAHAARRRPADLLRQMERDGFVAPSALDQRLLHRLDGLALAQALEYEAIQLSPVAPLGQCAAVAPTSQDRTLSAQRGTEVVSDPTNTLALLAAQRLTSAPAREVRLCTVHQVLRAQALPPVPGFSRNFRLFAMITAGPARADEGLEVDAILDHVARQGAILDAAADLGFPVSARRITIVADERRRALHHRLRERLAESAPRITIDDAPLTTTYYDGLHVTHWATAADGHALPIGDVGVFDWMARLTSNRRMRLVASGFGLQLLPLRFARSG